MTREELIKEVLNMWKFNYTLAPDEVFLEILKAINTESKHGQWTVTEKGAKITAYKCSECGRVVWDDTEYDVSKDYPYCHCGAKMDGEENE